MRRLKIFTASIAMLALASCGSGGDQGSLKGEPVAAVAPPAGKTWVEVATKTAEGGYLIGNPEAKIKLVEYASLSCPGCAQFAQQSTEELTEKYINSGKVSFEFRNFVRDELDLIASRITHCSSVDAMFPLTEQFMGFQATMFENLKVLQSDPAAAAKIEAMKGADRSFALAETAGIVDFFAQRGVSRDQAKACLADEKEMKKLAENTAEYGKKYDITGTPTFYLNGNKLDVSGWLPIKGKLQEAGAR